MALISYYASGTASVANGATAVTGAATQWAVAVREGDIFWGPDGVSVRIASVEAAGALTLAFPWPGAALVDGAYEIRITPAPSEITASVRELLEKLRQGLWLTPNATGTLAERAGYDSARRGFIYMQTDVEPFIVFVKQTDTAADWSPGFSPQQGPSGPFTTIEMGTVTTLASDQPATITPVQVGDVVTLNFGIPRGPTGDINGVTTFWNTRLGLDADAEAARTGLGAVGGPTSSIAGNLVKFGGTTGKSILDSGFKGFPSLSGLTLSMSTFWADGIIVAPGQASALEDNTPLVLAAALDKSPRYAWEAGSAGALDTGTYANGTYHVWLIGKPLGVDVDVLISTSPTAPVMPSGYTLKRRIACFTVVSDSARGFRQVGGWFHFMQSFEIAAGSLALPGGAAQLVSLDVPIGVKLEVEFAAFNIVAGGGASAYLGISDPDVGAATIYDTVAYNVGAAASTDVITQVRCWTNTNGQVSVYSNSPCTFRAFMRGYYDIRDTYF